MPRLETYSSPFRNHRDPSLPLLPPEPESDYGAVPTHRKGKRRGPSHRSPNTKVTSSLNANARPRALASRPQSANQEAEQGSLRGLTADPNLDPQPDKSDLATPVQFGEIATKTAQKRGLGGPPQSGIVILASHSILDLVTESQY